MPAENFGRQFVCWRDKVCRKKNGGVYGGRACCQKISPKFRQMEAELYNLWPAVGLINRARSNFRYAALPEMTFGYYGCLIKINKSQCRVEPADYAKGIVARGNLFMAQHYSIKLSKSQKKLFDSWSKQFPPTKREMQWANEVKRIEGYRNPYIQ